MTQTEQHPPTAGERTHDPLLDNPIGYTPVNESWWPQPKMDDDHEQTLSGLSYFVRKIERLKIPVSDTERDRYRDLVSRLDTAVVKLGAMK